MELKNETNLLPRILARIDKENKLTMKTKTRLLIVDLIVLLAVAVTLVSFPSVVTAMQHLFGHPKGCRVRLGEGKSSYRHLFERKQGITIRHDGFQSRPPELSFNTPMR